MKIVSKTVGFIVLCCIAVAVPAAAEVEDDQVSMDVVSSDRQQFVSQAGTEILADIESARALLSQNKRQEARSAVAAARAKLAEVRDVSPSMRIKDRIEAAIKNLRSGGKASPEVLLPIYADLDTVKSVDDYSDTIALVDRAKGSIGSGDVESATSALVEASAHLSYLEIDLPIHETYSNLTTALLKLTEKNPMGADTYLKNAEQGVQSFVAVVAKSETMEMPAVGAGPAE